MFQFLGHMEGTMRKNWLPSKSFTQLVKYEVRSVVCPFERLSYILQDVYSSASICQITLF